MADINTTLRGNNEEKEDPKSPGVIAKKIIQGLIIIILAVAVWTMSSWQLPVIVETVNCMFKNKLIYNIYILMLTNYNQSKSIHFL